MFIYVKPFSVNTALPVFMYIILHVSVNTCICQKTSCIFHDHCKMLIFYDFVYIDFKTLNNCLNFMEYCELFIAMGQNGCHLKYKLSSFR